MRAEAISIDEFSSNIIRTRWLQPRYPINIWNVHQRVLDGQPRTNNSVKGWHRAFQQTVDCHHPSVFKLIEHFRKEQDMIEIRLARIAAGIVQPEASKSKYVQLNHRLQVLVGNYANMESLDFLRSVSHNLEM